jgi:uncharacterized protein YeeX (DUF496 family)
MPPEDEFRGMVRERLLQIARSLEAIERDLRDHEHRVRDLEKRMWLAVGIVMAFSALSWIPHVIRVLQ